MLPFRMGHVSNHSIVHLFHQAVGWVAKRRRSLVASLMCLTHTVNTVKFHRVDSGVTITPCDSDTAGLGVNSSRETL